MNILNSENPKEKRWKGVTRLPQYASVILLALLANSCREEKSTHVPISSVPVPPVTPISVVQRDPFFVDITDSNFDKTVRSKIENLALKSPSFQKLVALVQNNPKILPYTFLDKEGILLFQTARGIPERNTMTELQDAGAFTSIQKDAIGVYLSDLLSRVESIF